jgi:S-adenosylmethionine-diacylglycerol 3-amino-3-carboxypropyl transferase
LRLAGERAEGVVRIVDLPQTGRRSLLERLVFRGIVFNMSWEDPRMDCEAFRIGGQDVVVSISSAGCNSLSLLCQGPKRLICVDGNPAQNAILELKLAGIAALDHETFFDIFAARRPGVVTKVYRSRLRPRLSVQARRFWDRNLWMVAGNLYRFGRMGLFCRILRPFLLASGIPRWRIEAFFELRDLSEQAEWYYRYAAPRLWRPWSRWLVRFKPFLYLAGVHPNQFRLVHDRHDIYDFIRERVEHVLTRVPIYDNYFLSQAVTGRFRGYRVPPYLLPENFEVLRRNLDRVVVVNGWLGPFLDTLPPRSVTRFNLLDIFDWMTPAAFEETLRKVLRVAVPGAIVIYRSGSYRLDPPEGVTEYFEPETDLARRLLAQDRSGTYGSFYVLKVKDGYDPGAVVRAGGCQAGDGRV